MELCGDSPKRIKEMCKTTDKEPVGIPIPLPVVLPSIENWYVATRKRGGDKWSIYASWAKYKAASELSTIDDAKITEVAAFPTMVQAVSYIKSTTSQSMQEPPAPLAVSLPTSPDHNQITKGVRPTNSAVLSRTAPINAPGSPKRGMHEKENEASEVIDVDHVDHNSNDATNDSKPSSPLQSDNPSKKRKIEHGLTPSSVPMQSGRLAMSQTSETIDIGGHKQREWGTSSLNALVMAASASSSCEREGNSHQPQKLPQCDKDSPEVIKNVVAAAIAEAAEEDKFKTAKSDGKRLPLSGNVPRDVDQSPREIVLSGRALLPQTKKMRLPVVPDDSYAPVAATKKSSVDPKHQERLQRIKNEQEELEQQIKKEEQKLHRVRSRASKLVIPSVPSTVATTSLKIPEVPSPVSQTLSNLKMNMDPRTRMNPNTSSLTSMGVMTDPRASLDSYPLGRFPRQLQHLPDHLQALQRPMYQNSPHLTSQLEVPRSVLHHQLHGNGGDFLQRPKSQHTNDLSDIMNNVHNQVDLKRYNGYGSLSKALLKK